VKPTNAVTVKNEFDDIHRGIRKFSQQTRRPICKSPLTPNRFHCRGRHPSLSYDGKDFQEADERRKQIPLNA